MNPCVDCMCFIRIYAATMMKVNFVNDRIHQNGNVKRRGVLNEHTLSILICDGCAIRRVLPRTLRFVYVGDIFRLDTLMQWE